MTCFVALVVVLVALRFYYVWQNSIKAGKIARGEALADADGVHGFEDVTDKVRGLDPIPMPTRRPLCVLMVNL